MNQREAKRFVCWHAAAVLENALSTNDTGSLTQPNGDKDMDGPNEDRVVAAWRDLISELERRGQSR